MTKTPERLDPPVEPARDHVLGPPDAAITLVEYGSYVCSYCHTAHEVIRQLRDEFGDRLRYVYRHLPIADRHEATRAAELAEYADATGAAFWSVHDTLMRRGPTFAEGELDAVGAEYGVPPREEWHPAVAQAATTRVRADRRSGIDSGARLTPTFFINGRRYEGAWDEASLREAMLRSLGHRIHAASVDFARWAPSTGVLLLVMTVLALVLSNSPVAGTFLSFWEVPAGLRFGGASLVLPLVEWVNHGLLTIFFLVVGLEVKRELTVGRLATPRAAAFPIAAAAGGIIMPTIIFTLMAPEAFRQAWGVTIATDTAFAIAILILLGERVPVDLRVFLTAAVIADDLVAIAVVAFFYSGALSFAWIGVSLLVTGAMLLLHRWQVYRLLPYAVLGVTLWVALHEGGIHATLAGVVLALVTPTRPPPNLDALLAQAQAIIDTETRGRGVDMPRTGPSEPALRALDAVHDRMESPASRLLRSVEPWSSYVVLPVFALANAGVVWAFDIVADRSSLVAALAVALVVGKLLGVLGGGLLAVKLGLSTKPPTYSWRQVAGAGALAGIGFTMSLFIASQAFEGADYSAAKIAIFLASTVAGVLGTAILWSAPSPDQMGATDGMGGVGTPIGGPREESG